MIDATNELARIRTRRATARRKPYRASRLQRYRAELVALRKAGATYPELVVWLKERRVKVVHTTVMRFLDKCPEVGQ